MHLTDIYESEIRRLNPENDFLKMQYYSIWILYVNENRLFY